MSSMREIVINTQERAVSTDINRLQKFKGKDLGDALMQMYLTELAFTEPGYASIATSRPVLGEVLGGLLVKPQTNSLGLLIDPGVLVVVNADGAPDESQCKFLNDVGVSGLGALVMSVNASGSTRIDVVECRINPVPDTVTDNRDIFNPTTGLFQAATVTKEIAARLDYRVRLGTPGAGYPGNITGWLPLMVASVPASASSNNDMTFWDVRPMLSDRERTAFVEGTFATEPTLSRLDAKIQRVSSGSVKVNGAFKGVFQGRVFGGAVRRGTPGTSADFVDVMEVANQEGSGTIAEPLTGHVYLYACFPKGLPRWALYAPNPSARLPQSPIGMLVASAVKPMSSGLPSATIALPDSTGLGGTIGLQEATCVAILPYENGGGQFQYGFVANRLLRTGGVLALTSDAISSGHYDFHVTIAQWPANARAIIADIAVNVTVPTVSSCRVDAFLNTYPTDAITAGADMLDSFTFYPDNPDSGSHILTHIERVRIAMPCAYPAEPGTRLVRLTAGATTIAGTSATLASTASLQVVGFEL